MTGKGLCRIVILKIIFDPSNSGIFTFTGKMLERVHRIVLRKKK